jgi:hypothetical protein
LAVTFQTLDKRINRDTEALHDFLWHGAKEGGPSLASTLLKDARDADTFLRLGGLLRRNAQPLAKGLGEPANGESLFELLEHSWALGAATILAVKKDYRGAAGRAKNAVCSASIGVCANAGCFEFVQEWEAGKIDFETYAGKLAAFLEPKGVLGAAQFKEMLNAVYNFGMNWKAASRPEQALAARASIDGAGWCLLTSVSIRELLGAPPKFSTRDFAGIVDHIVGRL